uniref:Uncharacterized protein n=1 Tax=Rhizophora mucronata TaxID=61149 RepID=A0A2P2QMR8_RHIMU
MLESLGKILNLDAVTPLSALLWPIPCVKVVNLLQHFFPGFHYSLAMTGGAIFYGT